MFLVRFYIQVIACAKFDYFLFKFQLGLSFQDQNPFRLSLSVPETFCRFLAFGYYAFNLDLLGLKNGLENFFWQFAWKIGQQVIS